MVDIDKVKIDGIEFDVSKYSYNMETPYIKEPIRNKNYIPQEMLLGISVSLKVGEILKIGKEKRKFIVKEFISFENGLYKYKCEEIKKGER